MDRQQRGVELGYDEAGVARGREIIAAVGFDNAIRDVAAAADELRRRLRDAGVSDQIGAVGYCWGGTVALLANTRLKLPAVSYYGGRSIPFLHERAGAALMFHFGARDSIIPPEHVARIRAAYPQAESFVYQAGHGFNCDARADYDAAAAAEARQRALAFFAREVG
jgi:carboxymethylenebutenolidase